MSWRDHAPCRGYPTEWWFPEWGIRGSHPDKAHHLTRTDAASWSPAAVAICAGCPVADPCLAYALQRRLDGIWAGTTPTERLAIARRAGITIIDDTNDTEGTAA